MADFVTETAIIEGKEVSYPVKRRDPEETARLYRLMRELDNERVFTYSCTPKGRRVDLLVKTISLKDAASQGRISLDELAADR